ncbi:aldose epimerase family protein [Oscillatoria salina]|uniref:aldose epimerase family protein n=1 Tax=Oscillatoria salina TaxID=331517 RepID=UPI001CCAD6F0|nr:aldose epimerase [Oscillatoria salina]
MFAIAVKQEQYQTYILSHEEAMSRLEVVPERGGIITQWRIQGQDLLYLDAERFANPKMSVRGGIPILFPICGNLPNDVYTYQGEQYSLKQHGFARDLPWQVTNTETDDLASITLVLNSNEQTLAVYPFKFQLAFTYELKENSLKIHQRYTNNSQTTMPFSTGLHPYFLIADKKLLSFDLPASQIQAQDTKEVYPFEGSFDFDADEIDVALFPVTKNSASITHNRRRFKITINYSELYSALVFWTVKGKDYVCLEPWSALRNALNTGERLTHLEPGATCEATVAMEVMYL